MAVTEGAARLFRAVDAISTVAARVGEVLLVAIAAMLFCEVVLRYVFLAPTKWTHDVSIVAQIWMTYLGMALVLRRCQLIRITAMIGLIGATGKRLVEAFSLVVIAAFCLVAVIYGLDVIVDSIRLGRRQPTMLAMPQWIGEAPVILGFALLFVQALCDLIRLPARPVPDFAAHDEMAPSKPAHDAATR